MVLVEIRRADQSSQKEVNGELQAMHASSAPSHNTATQLPPRPHPGSWLPIELDDRGDRDKQDRQDEWHCAVVDEAGKDVAAAPVICCPAVNGKAMFSL